jgi:hypothetical protein
VGVKEDCCKGIITFFKVRLLLPMARSSAGDSGPVTF